MQEGCRISDGPKQLAIPAPHDYAGDKMRRHKKDFIPSKTTEMLLR